MIDITLTKINNEDFISLTDIARSKNNNEPKDVVKNWLRNKNTIEFLGLWETINNENFKVIFQGKTCKFIVASQEIYREMAVICCSQKILYPFMKKLQV